MKSETFHKVMEKKLEIHGAMKDILLHKTILVTRPKNQSLEFIHYLESSGASVISFPVIRIIEPEDWKDCDEAIRNIESFNVIVFTSANAVEFFMKRYSMKGEGELSEKQIFSVGPKTQEALNSFNVRTEKLSSQNDGRELALNMIQVIDKKSKILFPHGDKGRYELAGLLRESGLLVREIVVYNNVAPEKEEMERMKMLIEKIKVDVITFFSPSSIGNLLRIISSQYISSSVVAVIGSTTADAVRNLGLPVHIIAGHPSSKDLAQAIVTYYKN